MSPTTKKGSGQEPWLEAKPERWQCHDTFTKRMLAYPGVFKSLFKQYLPTVYDKLNWKKLAKASNELVTKLGKKHVDLLYTCQSYGGTIAYLHIEQQTSMDAHQCTMQLLMAMWTL